MKTPTLIIAVLLIFATSLNAQDMFNARRLTFDPAQQGFSTWLTDGKSIIYQYTDLKDTTGKNGLWKISLNGSGAEQVFMVSLNIPNGHPMVAISYLMQIPGRVLK